jgi:hypothetical protein
MELLFSLSFASRFPRVSLIIEIYIEMSSPHGFSRLIFTFHILSVGLTTLRILACRRAAGAITTQPSAAPNSRHALTPLGSHTFQAPAALLPDTRQLYRHRYGRTAYQSLPTKLSFTTHYYWLARAYALSFIKCDKLLVYYYLCYYPVHKDSFTYLFVILRYYAASLA